MRQPTPNSQLTEMQEEKIASTMKPGTPSDPFEVQTISPIAKGTADSKTAQLLVPVVHQPPGAPRRHSGLPVDDELVQTAGE